MASPSPPEKITSPTSPETRIITHLNNDHQRELSHYLRHYCHVPALESLNPLLTSITFDKMTIQTRSGTTYTVPIDPPMSTWADARLRAVSMDQTCRSALGIEDVYVDKYILPSKPAHVAMFVICSLNLIQTIAYYTGILKPGSGFFDLVGRTFPGGAEGYEWFVRWVGLGTVLIHACEAVVFDRARMKGGRFGVVRGTGLWATWVGCQFVEGMGNWFQFDREVARKRKEKEGKKH